MHSKSSLEQRWQVLHTGLAESYQKKLALSVFGIDSAVKISGLLEKVVGDILGWRKPECFLFEISVGAVFGLSEGGEQCIFKAFSRDTEIDALKSQSRFQRYVARQGFPCPPVISEPLVREGIVFTIEGYMGRGRRADGHRPM